MRRLLSLHISISWTSKLRLILSHDVETNPGPRSPSKSPRKTTKEGREGAKDVKGVGKIRRSKSSVRDSGLREGSQKFGNLSKSYFNRYDQST